MQNIKKTLENRRTLNQNNKYNRYTDKKKKNPNMTLKRVIKPQEKTKERKWKKRPKVTIQSN